MSEIPKLGEVITLDVTEINNLGVGVARHNGLVVFVKGGVSGDTLMAEVIKITKSFAVARLCKIITPSPFRECADSACAEKLSCGGCVWRGVSYEHELEMKRASVRASFMRAGVPDAEILPVLCAGKVYRYRNKAQYPVCKTKNGVLAGFYAAKTHNIIPIDDCKIQNEAFAPIVRFVCDFADKHGISVYDEKSGKGLLRHIYLRSGDMSGEIMLCLVLSGESLPCRDDFVRGVTERFPLIVSIMLNKNAENTNVVLGDKYTLLFGKPFIEDVLCGLKFKIAPEAFYQVNHDGAELLYSKAAELCECDNEDVIDLYCGTGTIGLSMAHRVSRVLGIDIVEKSIECAKENAEKNGILNAHFACTDAGKPENIRKCAEKYGFSLSKSTVIMDPPRKGSTPELIEFLAAERVQKIVYISCNPDTLARDAARFISLGYKMSEVTPVNMFPRTGHVESIVCLNRKTTHEMKLHASPFEKIKSGTKTIELRLYDEKRQKIKAGDDIIFTNTVNGEKMYATVKKLHRFNSFEELYKTLPLLQCGYTAEDVDTAHPSDMEQYYSAEEQKQYGVVGIELFPPKRITDESVVCLSRK